MTVSSHLCLGCLLSAFEEGVNGLEQDRLLVRRQQGDLFQPP
jgi:hypothetical protein